MKLRTTKTNWTVLALAIGDLAFAYVTPATYFRLAPFFRIALFANASSDVRRELYLLVQLLPGLSSVVLLVVCWVVFFAFFALVLFNSIPGSEHYFGTFGRSMWQLWVLATTSNWPDVRPRSAAQVPVHSGKRMNDALMDITRSSFNMHHKRQNMATCTLLGPQTGKLCRSW